MNKTKRGREAYRKSLTASFDGEDSTDGVERHKNPFGTTTETDDEEEEIKPSKPRKAPLGARAGDFIKEHWVTGVVLPALFLLLGWSYEQGKEIAVIDTNVKDIKEHSQQVLNTSDNGLINDLRRDMDESFREIRQNISQLSSAISNLR